MRVIAGTARSIPLKAPEGLTTRPTTDRIKETLFNMLQQEIPHCTFLDLFGGSGAIGIEALSRGASCAVFVESSKKAAQCITENLQRTKLERNAVVYAMDYLGAFAMMNGKYTFDIVFMDPPYNQGLEKEVLGFFASSQLIDDQTVIIIEAALDTDFSYVEELGFQIRKRKEYKTNVHVFLERGGDSE